MVSRGNSIVRGVQGPEKIVSLNGEFTQAQVFRLKGKMPSHESILSVKGHDLVLNPNECFRVPGFPIWVRTGEYGVYARGFQKDLDAPVGTIVIWTENNCSYSFIVPDARHPGDKDKALCQASGMLVFPIDKLEYDERYRVVSVSQSFDPARDVRVVDIMRPGGWALVDGEGYPVRGKPSDIYDPDARCAYLRSPGEFFPNASGWHGSIARGVDFGGYQRRAINAELEWRYPSGVSVIVPRDITERKGSPVPGADKTENEVR